MKLILSKNLEWLEKIILINRLINTKAPNEYVINKVVCRKHNNVKYETLTKTVRYNRSNIIIRSLQSLEGGDIFY